MKVESRLPEIEPNFLLSLVSSECGADITSLLDWDCQPIGVPTGQATGGVYRVAGTALGHDTEADWSFILKIVSSPDADPGSIFQDITHPLYWKREVLAYRSGLLANLPGGLRPPLCYSMSEQSDGSYWIWLEDVKDSYGHRWPLDQFRRTAYKLGRFNGAYLASQELPNCPWLVRNGTPRGLLDHNTWILDCVENPETWARPFLKAAFPVPIADRLARLWKDRALFLGVLDQIPQTFCHLDAWRGNFFAPQRPDGDDRLVVIDWAFPGFGAVGIDAGDLFAPGFGMCAVEPCEPEALDMVIFENYMDGLRDAGWSGAMRLVRLAFAAYSATKYGCFTPWLLDAQDENKYGIWEQVSGQAMPEFLRSQGKLLYYLLDLADEARSLLEEVKW